jgi:iron complex outermembrane recepter protein
MRIPIVLAAVALALWLAAPVVVEAQTGTVSGRVLSDDGSPVSGAQVSVMGTGRGALTNARGAFNIGNVPTGAHTLQVQSLGYSTAEISIEVVEGGTVNETLRVSPEAVIMEGIHVTVGSRTGITAADELVVPVDVYSRAELELASPQLEMGTVLSELSPSVYFPRPQIADLTSGIRPFQLRGLSPDHSLVLVNGKRRHSTAIVHVFGAASGGSGSSGVDMNALVPSALGGMEILRDGAAAQYGSDAIAGVVNVQLRDDIHAPEFNLTLGQYRPSDFDPDGERIEASGSWGFGLGEDRGTMVISGMYSHREPTFRSGADPRDQVVPGDADVTERDSEGILRVVEKRNQAPQPNHLTGDGETDNVGFFLNSSYDLRGDGAHNLYAFGGYSWRRDLSSGFYRRGIDNRNWPEIHSVGFLPSFRGETSDLQAVLGLEGFAGDWAYDLSGQWGRNRLDTDIYNSLNVSLGPCLDSPCAPGPWPAGVDPIPNKTDMYAGAVAANQGILAADVVREVEIGTHSPLNVALGTAFRADNFQLHAGEPASWVNGGHLNRSGGVAAPGAQVFTGFRPDQEVDEWRTNVGVYADVEADVTSGFRLAGAARFENYSDFGSTVTGKLATRIQPHESFILRGAVSTGFRAPNLNQSYYSHVSTGFRSVLDEDGEPTGDQEAYEIGEIPVESPEARALGAEPLREETSLNLSAGLAFSPTENLTFTLDGYQIDVDDRIILTGSLSGPTVEALLADFGAPTVKFFTNSVDTRTRGIDVSARLRQPVGVDRYVEVLGQYNRNTVEVTNVQVPDVIGEIRDQVFGSGDRYVLENGRPKDRATVRSRYVQGPFNVALSANFYGVQAFRLEEGQAGQPDVFLDNGPHVVWNGSLGYTISERLGLFLGVENLTNKRPPVRPDGYDFLGIFPFYSTSGLSMNGQYIYTRINVKL